MESAIQNILPQQLCPLTQCKNTNCQLKHPDWIQGKCVEFLRQECSLGSSCSKAHVPWETLRLLVEQSSSKIQHSSKKQPSSKSKGTKPCSYFLQGNCNKGDKCTFSHENLSQEDKPAQPYKQKNCRYYQKGNCIYKDACRDIHQLTTPQKKEQSSDPSTQGSVQHKQEEEKQKVDERLQDPQVEMQKKIVKQKDTSNIPCHRYHLNLCKLASCSFSHVGEPNGICLYKQCKMCYFIDTQYLKTILEGQPGWEELFQQLQEISNTQRLSVKTVRNAYLAVLEDVKTSEEAKDALFQKLSELTQSFQVFIETIWKAQRFLSRSPQILVELICFELKKYHEGLPAYRLKLEFIDEARNFQNNFCLVIGETGSGKSTQLPQYYYSDHLRTRKQIMICVQPRKIAALSLAKRISEELKDQLGGVVGYDFGKKDKLVSERTKIILMTEKVFLDKVIKDMQKRKEGKLHEFRFVGAVLLDEVHERTMTIDLIMGMLRDTVNIYKNLKVIICSATVNENLFTSYFNQCKVIRIKGRAYPVEEYYQPVNGADGYIDGAFNVIQQICEQKKKGTFQYNGHILVFVISVEEMDILQKIINNYFSENNLTDQYAIHYLHGKLEQEEQQKVFREDELLRTKIVLATKIAECSITINGVRVVVDSGMDKDAFYDSQKKMNVLETKYISQAAANQRKGRAGRTSPGICYRLYSQDELASFEPDNKPEIKKMNLEAVILKIKQAGWLNVYEFPFFEKPDNINLQNAHQILRLLQATNEDGSLTDEGIVMTKLPTNPTKSKAIIQAFRRGCLDEILKVISLETFSGNLYKKIDRKAAEQPMTSQLISDLKSNQSDHLVFLELMNQWISLKTFSQKKDWCKQHLLNMKAFSNASTLHLDLRQSVFGLTNAKTHPCLTLNEMLEKEDIRERILKCLFASYYMSLSREMLNRNFIFQGLFATTTFRINNSSALSRLYLQVSQKQTFLIIFSEMISLPHLNLASNVSAINPDYLKDESIRSKELIEECSRKEQEIAQDAMKEYTFTKGTLTQLMRAMTKKFRDINTSYQSKGITVDTKYDYDKGLFAAIYSKTKDGILENQFLSDIDNQIKEFMQKQQSQKLVVQFEGTPIRAVIDSQFNIQELVFEHEFIAVSLKGLPTNISNEVLLQKLHIDKSFLTSYSSKEIQFKSKSQTSLQLNFTSKVLAQEFHENFQLLQHQFQQASCLPHYQKMQHLNEKIILKATWCIGKSKCIASIYYENEVDPERALGYINDRVIDGCKIKAKINRKNPKKLELEGLSPFTDEQTLKMFVRGFYSQPKIVILREEPKNQNDMSFAQMQIEGNAFVNQFNESFEELLLSNQLGDMINRMTIEYSSNKQYKVHAVIYLNSEQEGEDLVNKYDGKVGIIGTQKLRLQIKNKFVLKYNDPKIFEVMKEELGEQSVLLQSQHENSLFIQMKQDAIVIQGIDSQVNRKAASQLDLLCQGIKVFVDKFILDKHYDIIKQQMFDVINNKYRSVFKCDCVYLKRTDQCHVQLLLETNRLKEKLLKSQILQFRSQRINNKLQRKGVNKAQVGSGSKRTLA